MSNSAVDFIGEFDYARRFGGIERLYGQEAAQTIQTLRIAVVGLGGVGSWAAEALARSGIGSLTLIDLDHIAQSNINRQVHALSSTLGQAKVLAMQERIAQIHPLCLVHAVEAFVETDQWPHLLPDAIDGVIDACDQVQAKVHLAIEAKRLGLPLVCVGAAGGKKSPQAVSVADLAKVTHDPLLGSVRRRLRHVHQVGLGTKAMGLTCVFSPQPVSQDVNASLGQSQGGLQCHGYGSSVMLTATFGMVAAAEMVHQLMGTPKL